MSNEMSELDISISNGMSEVEAKPKTKSKEIIMSKIVSEEEANDINSELEAIRTIISDLEEDFGDLGLEEASSTSTELDNLNSLIEGTDFAVLTEESSGAPTPTILDMADGNMQEGWLPDWIDPVRIIKNKAKKIIKRIVRLVNKYRKLATCIPAVTKAAAAFAAKKYGTALRYGVSASGCIAKRL